MADLARDNADRAERSDGLAQAVCQAIKAHLAHGGRLPWPSIARPYEEWAKLHREDR